MSDNNTVPEYLTGAEVLRIVRSNTRNPRQSLYALRKAGLPAVFHLGHLIYPTKRTLRFLRSGSRRQLSLAS